MSAERAPEHCADCRYFVPGQRVSTEPHDGTCHFSPPSNYSTPHPDSGATEVVDDDYATTTTVTFIDGTYTGWPIVQSSDWCGCFEEPPPVRKPRTRKPAA